MMRIKDIKSYCDDQISVPEEKKRRDTWFEMNDFFNFLILSQDEMVPIYLSNNSHRSFFIYSIIVPENKLQNGFIDDLRRWSLDINDVYGYVESYSTSKGKYEFKLSDPSIGDSEFLEGAIPIFFLRNCFNYTSTKIEINQKISHVLDLCWDQKKNAFCKLNELGDYVEIATIENEDKLTLCTLKKEDLDLYLYLSKSVLIRFYDVMRYSKDFSKSYNDKRQRLVLNDSKNEIYASLDIEKMDNDEFNFSWLLGFQIIRNKVPDKKMLKKLRGEEDREYESFIIHDFKNERIIEWSSDPQELSNYFIESDKPFETSYACFNPEVLLKYKQNPDKYKVNTQNIDCIGAWDLNNIDINEEGQVTAFMYELSRLPYSEQKYWKSFNEKPKSGLSKRTFNLYFKGEWDTEYDPLTSLKNILDIFPIIKSKETVFYIWKLPKTPNTRSINVLNYVLTESTKEWEDQISILYQMLIEGLRSKTISKLAKKLECYEKNIGSVNQLKKCLESLNVDKKDMDVIVNPLFELIHLRKIVIHTIDEPYPNEDLKVHYRNLLEKCDKSMRKLADLINEGLFNISEEK